MSEIWNEAEEKIKKLKSGELSQGKLKGYPVFSNFGVMRMDYHLPVKPDDEVVGKILSSIDKNEEVGTKSHTTNTISVYDRNNELLLLMGLLSDSITVLCYSKQAAKIVDEIAKELKLY